MDRAGGRETGLTRTPRLAPRCAAPRHATAGGAGLGAGPPKGWSWPPPRPQGSAPGTLLTVAWEAQQPADSLPGGAGRGLLQYRFRPRPRRELARLLPVIITSDVAPRTGTCVLALDLCAATNQPPAYWAVTLPDLDFYTCEMRTATKWFKGSAEMRLLKKYF